MKSFCKIGLDMTKKIALSKIAQGEINSVVPPEFGSKYLRSWLK